MNSALLMGIVLLLVLQAIETWRRMRDPGFLSPRQFWRRILTAGLGQVVLVMWLIGEQLMAEQPPLTRLAYWGASVLLVIVIPFLALRDMIDLMRTYHRQRAELFRTGGPDAPDGPPAGLQGDRAPE
jgi:ABC-type amino acid transport system permease subunit